MIEEYLDADILVIGSRNTPTIGKFPVELARDYDTVTEILSRDRPELVLGSSFEEYACPGAAFVGVTPPIRGMFRLHSRPLSGIEGAFALFESILNVCMDKAKKRKGSPCDRGYFNHFHAAPIENLYTISIRTEIKVNSGP